MCEEKITFERLPQAITRLSEQVSELKQLLTNLQVKPENKRKLIGIDEASEIIKKAKPTIYALVRNGKLPSYKKGKQLYFYEDELLSWVEDGRKISPIENFDKMLANMQKGVRHKPKSGINF